jgi:hypothetical protein
MNEFMKFLKVKIERGKRWTQACYSGVEMFMYLLCKDI